MDMKLSRRDILKGTTAGLGLAICGGETSLAQRGGGRGGRPLNISANNPAIVMNRNRCRRCGQCSEYCRNVTTVEGRSVPPGEDACIHCGQCTFVCQNYAITERFDYPGVTNAIAAEDKIVIASTSPAVRVSLGEMFRQAPGTNVEGKMIGSLRKLGINHVLDTTFSADLTVMEEASELIQRLTTKNAPLPMFTSCCPAWVRFAKLFYPKLLPHISTAKSPVLMQGAMIKTYFAKQQNIDPAKIFHVAVTPCTAKKAEILLPGMNASGVFHQNPEMRDVDAVITSRELSYMINGAKLDWNKVETATYDLLMGAGSGAGMIFGNTGGVMEAALRTAYWLLNQKNPPQEFLELKPVRGYDNVRLATVDLGVKKLKVAVVHGIGSSRTFLDAIQSGKEFFDFVEVMACPGGCIGGGGQPKNTTLRDSQLKAERIRGLYNRDQQQTVRLSHENPEIQAIYADFLEKPLSTRSEQLLHKK